MCWSPGRLAITLWAGAGVQWTSALGGCLRVCRTGCVDEAGQREFFTGGNPRVPTSWRGRADLLTGKPSVHRQGNRNAASSLLGSIASASGDFQTLTVSDSKTKERRGAVLSSSRKGASDFPFCATNEFGEPTQCGAPSSRHYALEFAKRGLMFSAVTTPEI